jgi:hypothetical protein
MLKIRTVEINLYKHHRFDRLIHSIRSEEE